MMKKTIDSVYYALAIALLALLAFAAYKESMQVLVRSGFNLLSLCWLGILLVRFKINNAGSRRGRKYKNHLCDKIKTR